MHLWKRSIDPVLQLCQWLPILSAFLFEKPRQGWERGAEMMGRILRMGGEFHEAYWEEMIASNSTTVLGW